MNPTTCPGTLGYYIGCSTPEPGGSVHAALADLGSAWMVLLVILVTLGLIALAVWIAAQHG